MKRWHIKRTPNGYVIYDRLFNGYAYRYFISISSAFEYIKRQEEVKYYAVGI